MRKMTPGIAQSRGIRATAGKIDVEKTAICVTARVTLAALLLASAGAAPAANDERIPRIGLAGDDLDACLSNGRVTGLNPGGDNYLAVRALPATTAREKDRLGPGAELWICDEAGDWMGVVYDPDALEGAGDCGVGTPSDRVRLYPGPCRSGWVHSRYVVVIAG
jgi:hypothetical protein